MHLVALDVHTIQAILTGNHMPLDQSDRTSQSDVICRQTCIRACTHEHTNLAVHLYLNSVDFTACIMGCIQCAVCRSIALQFESHTSCTKSSTANRLASGSFAQCTDPDSPCLNICHKACTNSTGASATPRSYLIPIPDLSSCRSCIHLSGRVQSGGQSDHKRFGPQPSRS